MAVLSPTTGSALDRDALLARLCPPATVAVLVVAAFVAVGTGAVAIPPHTVIAILLDAVGLPAPWPFEPRQATVLLAIRLPRVLLGVLAGGALSVAGAALQGLFRNPLADPGLIGVSTGAALAAALMIVLGSPLLAALPALAANFALPFAAFLGGLVTTLLIYRFASRDGHTEVATMLLAGVALNAIAGAVIGLLTFLSDDQELRDMNFWMLGSLGGITWDRLIPAAPVIVAASAGLALLARQLNALVLGETEALHLGIEVERVKRTIVVLAALAVGASVALTGVIGFVGLVVPHLVRLMIGPDHHRLLPTSIALGSALLILADLLARTVVLPAELPIGILTSCVGGPFFLWLLSRRRAMGMW
jgi:iron complex transport system permease protein